MGSTNRGAIGLIVVDGEAELEPHRVVLADGKVYSEEERKDYVARATRIASPFGIGTMPVDRPVVYGPETEEGEYDYICTPHPYMLGRVVVKAPPESAREEVVKTSGTPVWLVVLVIGSLIFSAIALAKRRK